MTRWPLTTAWNLTKFQQNLFSRRSLDDRISVFEEAIETSGYNAYIFGATPSDDPDDIFSLIGFSSMPKQWQEEYQARGYYRHDAVVQYCMTETNPLLWSELERRERQCEQYYSAEHMVVSNHARSHGIRVGVTIPIRIAWTPITFEFSIGRLNTDDFDGHDGMFEIHEGTLIGMAHLFASQKNFSSLFAKHFKIPNRQMEYLQRSLRAASYADVDKSMNVATSTGSQYRKELCERIGTDSFSEVKWRYFGLALPPDLRSN